MIHERYLAERIWAAMERYDYTFASDTLTPWHDVLFSLALKFGNIHLMETE